MFSSFDSRMLKVLSIMHEKNPKPSKYALFTVNFFDSSYDYTILKDRPLIPESGADKKGKNVKKKIRALFLVDSGGFLLYPAFSIADGTSNSDRDLIESLVNIPEKCKGEAILIEAKNAQHYDKNKDMDKINFTSVKRGARTSEDKDFLEGTFQKSNEPIVEFANLFGRFSKIRVGNIKEDNMHAMLFVIATILFNIKRMTELGVIKPNDLHSSWREAHAGYCSNFVPSEIESDISLEYDKVRYQNNEKQAQNLLEDFLKNLNSNDLQAKSSTDSLAQSQEMGKGESQDSGVGQEDSGVGQDSS